MDETGEVIQQKSTETATLKKDGILNRIRRVFSGGEKQKSDQAESLPEKQQRLSALEAVQGNRDFGGPGINTQDRNHINQLRTEIQTMEKDQPSLTPKVTEAPPAPTMPLTPVEEKVSI